MPMTRARMSPASVLSPSAHGIPCALSWVGVGRDVGVGAQRITNHGDKEDDGEGLDELHHVVPHELHTTSQRARQDGIGSEQCAIAGEKTLVAGRHASSGSPTHMPILTAQPSMSIPLNLSRARIKMTLPSNKATRSSFNGFLTVSIFLTPKYVLK